MNLIHRGQGLASPNEAWQTWRQETQGRISLSDSFSSRFYCWMFISDLGGSIVAPFHFLACITRSVQSPTNSLFTFTASRKQKCFYRHNTNLDLFSQPSHSLLVYVVAILNSMARPLCYQKTKFHDALLSFVLSRTFGSVSPTLFGGALLLQCPARWGSPCRQATPLQPSHKTPSTQTPQKNLGLLKTYNW